VGSRGMMKYKVPSRVKVMMKVPSFFPISKSNWLQVFQWIKLTVYRSIFIHQQRYSFLFRSVFWTFSKTSFVLLSHQCKLKDLALIILFIFEYALNSTLSILRGSRTAVALISLMNLLPFVPLILTFVSAVFQACVESALVLLVGAI